MEKEIENLEQYDFILDEYIYSVLDKYSLLIGKYMINFSILEHELNVAIAEIISDRAHELGYVIIEKLSMYSKIELFFKLYNMFVKELNNKIKDNLFKLTDSLKTINNFRNNIVHAQWETLKKNGSVRIKIYNDIEEGRIKFKRLIISTKIIRENIKLIDKTYKILSKFPDEYFHSWHLDH